ncbi:MAG: TolC family protein, partial [Enterobacter sp.]|nr:TolC family protein [Enterobacter sp.]
MKRSLTLSLSAPLIFMLSACAPEHATVSPVKTQAAAAAVNTQLSHADWPKNEWWKDFNDPQLNALIAKALADAPDMQIARQRITLAEAQAKATVAADGPQMDFSADVERQKMSAEGLM